MVEVTERRTGHRFACAHPGYQKAMIVKVNTPKVIRYRKSVMEFLLAHHPLRLSHMRQLANAGCKILHYEPNLFPGRYKTVRMDAPVIRDNPLLVQTETGVSCAADASKPKVKK